MGANKTKGRKTIVNLMAHAMQRRSRPQNLFLVFPVE